MIAGPHPDGGDLHFRWREGNSPEEVGIADCPVWLLRGMILDHQRQQINAEIALEAKQTRAADGELTPIEKLTPKEQKDAAAPDVREVALPGRFGRHPLSVQLRS